jgi:hypothetical protein
MLEKSVLDSGEICGVKWEAIGISPACAWELVATYGTIQASAFTIHPLLLFTPEKRQLRALDLVLPAVAKKLDIVAATGRQAADSIRALRKEGPEVDAARRLADRWVQLTAAVAGAAEDRVAAAA